MALDCFMKWHNSETSCIFVKCYLATSVRESLLYKIKSLDRILDVDGQYSPIDKGLFGECIQFKAGHETNSKMEFRGHFDGGFSVVLLKGVLCRFI